MIDLSVPIRRFLGAAVASLALASGASALTIQEGSTDFSNNWLSPTQVGWGVTGISGSAAQNDLEVFALSGLLPGAQTLTFDFSGEQSYAATLPKNFLAGGSIVYSYTPFQFAGDQDGILSYTVDYHKFVTGSGNKQKLHEGGSLTSSYALTLASSFTGTLYLAIAPTTGPALSYNITLPAAPLPPTPVPVPLPASGALLALALIGLGIRRAGRKAA